MTFFYFLSFLLSFLRSHSSLDFFTPYETHFDTHISSHISRFNSGQHFQRQKDTFTFFSTHFDNRLQIGDRVLLRSKKRYFEKLSPVFYPKFLDDIFTIDFIDKRYLPWTFKLAEISSNKRRFYAFELRKLDPSYQTKPTHSSSPDFDSDNTILVKDITIRDKTNLRSGKIVPGKGRVFYVIERNGKKDELSEAALTTLQRALGRTAIKYDDTFQQPSKQQYILYNKSITDYGIRSYQFKRRPI